MNNNISTTDFEIDFYDLGVDIRNETLDIIEKISLKSNAIFNAVEDVLDYCVHDVVEELENEFLKDVKDDKNTLIGEFKDLIEDIEAF